MFLGNPSAKVQITVTTKLQETRLAYRTHSAATNRRTYCLAQYLVALEQMTEVGQGGYSNYTPVLHVICM